jgi:hypothetical protein
MAGTGRRGRGMFGAGNDIVGSLETELMNLVYMPPWSARAILVLAAVLVVLAAIRWRREKRGAVPFVLRALILGLLIFVVLNPQSILPREKHGKPRLIVLLDRSASMGTREADHESRFNAAFRAITNAMAVLDKEFDLSIRTFDRDTQPLEARSGPSGYPPVPEGDASDIRSALLKAVSELGEAKAQAGVLLISDGRATTPDTLEAGQLALARSVPLWTWTLGGAVPRRDLWIETASSEALAFNGSDVELAATLRVAGYPNRSFRVEALREDKVIESRELVPDTNGMARMVLHVQAPPAGEQRYLFRVPAEPDEADSANNERAIFVRTIGEKVRVLVAEGQPHWDTKFLVQSLKRDSHIDLTAVYRLNANRHMTILSLGGNETRAETDLFPRDQKSIDNFDVIVLGRGAEGFFDAKTEAMLTEFISRRGGSIVFARGKPYGGRFQPLAKFEPVAWGSGLAAAAKMRPTEAGRDNPIFNLGAAGTLDELLERLPALDHVSVTLGEKPLAVVLASSPEQDGPVLAAYQRYGQGKALSLNAAGLWRWSFRETGQEESEIAYRRFWISLLQWLLAGGQFLPGADTALATAHRYYTSEQPMQFLIHTRNLDPAAYQPRLTITSPGSSVEVEPRARGDAFIAEAGPFNPGSYRVVLKNNIGKPAELSQNVEVVSASVEKQELSADPELMRQLAETSGGATLTASDVARLPQLVQRWEAARQLAHRQQPVWDRWWILGVFVALLGTEWWLRRREGLL